MSGKRYEDTAYHSGIQANTFLGNRPSVRNCVWHFEILTRDSVGNLKMWNISKTANEISKNLGLGVRQCIYVGYILMTY